MTKTSTLISLLAALAQSTFGQATNSPVVPRSNAPAAPIVIRSRVSPYHFNDGDRVVLVGDTLIERAQKYGYLEARILAHNPGEKIYFRNLGWSADTPAGQSRMSFDWNKPKADWFQHLTNQIASVHPSVVLVGYGMANSFDGDAGLAQFQQDLEHLIDAVQSLTNRIHVILLGPIRHENLGAPLPDPAKHNELLKKYSDAIGKIADARHLRFIPLFDLLRDGTLTRPPRPLTDDGIHLNDFGYWRMAEAVERGLGWEPNWWRVGITSEGQFRYGGYGVQTSNLQKKTNYVRFDAKFECLANPPYSNFDRPSPTFTPPSMLQFRGLAPGNYTLFINGKAAQTNSDREWGRGVPIRHGAFYDDAEALRQVIVKKDELYFHRWRPQNMTYLFGFRKYEQGQNAREIPMFDPLISKEESKIFGLNKSKPYVFELVQAGGEPQFKEPALSTNRTDRVTEAISQSSSRGATEKKLDPSAHSAQGTALPSAKSAAGKSPAPLRYPDFELAPGFEVSLYAEDPLLAKPIQMNFDPQGRLWVASSEVYPQIEPGQTANDKVLVLEDSQHQGKVDRSRVFADGLLIPTGVLPGNGGVYVGQSTELLFFKDSKGDGKADQKQIVLSSFGTEDTHHIIHTLRWGPDGELYFNQSIYIHSHIETPQGIVRLNSGGVFQFRPDTMGLGVFLRGFCNPWGHAWDQFGQSFVTDGAGFQGISFGIPGATYFTYADMRRELRSVSPGSYPKFASLEIVRSQQFPEDWQGNLITCDFRAHRVVRFAISEQGSGYVTKEMPDLVRSQNVAFRPIDVKLGPDGALYIADWSNPIIQHGEVDFRDPRRDHEHGRIWRVTAKGRPLAPRIDFARASNVELLDQLLSPNAYDEQQARRVLTERKKTILPDLERWAKAQSGERGRLEALWMYQSLDIVQPAVLEQVLKAQDGRIRAAGLRTVGAWANRLSAPLEILAAYIHDPHPRARLEAVRAVAKIPNARAAELVLTALDQPTDDFLDYAVWLGLNDLAQPWVDAIRSGAWNPQGREKQLEFGLQAIEPKLASSVLSRLLQSHPFDHEGNGPWIELIGKAGGAEELRILAKVAFAGQFSEAATARALAALNTAARLRQAKPPGELPELAQWLDANNPKVQLAAVQLAGNWKARAAVPKLIALAESLAGGGAVPDAAFTSLKEINGSEVQRGLRHLAGKENPLPTRQRAAETLAAIDPPGSLPLVLDLFSAIHDSDQALGFWRALLTIKGAPSALAHALNNAQLNAIVGKAGLRVAREGARAEPELVMAIAKSAQLNEEEQALSQAELQKIAQHALQQGDPARGEKIFRRTELGCVTCHAIGGVGGKVGPDLTSVGASAPPDYLVESVLYPNRKVKEGYHSVLVSTKDGEEYSGILVRETNEQLVLRDATNREIEIAKNKIESRRMGGSLMPAGLAEALSPSEQADLYRFLSELGKPGPFDASKGNVARFWHLCAETIDSAQFGDEKVINSSFASQGWSVAPSRVDGQLPSELLDAKIKSIAWRSPMAIYAGTELQVPKAGPVRLRISGVSPLALWIDGRTVTAQAASIQPKLDAGTHRIVLKIDAKKLPDSIRLETTDGTFLTN